MRDVMEISAVISQKIDRELIPKLANAQRNTAIKVWEDTVASAPMVTGNYVASITLGDTKIEDDMIKTQIYSELKVGGDNPKWRDVLLANFINYGTGPLGKDTNIIKHGYPYTTDHTWNLETEIQRQLTGTWGIKANPHFYKSLQKNIDTYKNEIRKCFK